MKRVTALFSIETHRKLKLAAFNSNRTLIQIINEAVEEWLKANLSKDSRQL